MTRWRVQFSEVWQAIVVDAPDAASAIILAASFAKREAEIIVTHESLKVPYRIDVLASLDYRDGIHATHFEARY